MICNRCGKEFGNGSICQNCGADKVTALGEFSGYSEQRGLRDSPYVSSLQHSLRIESVPTLICWKCGEVIPGDSKYCPVCQTQLFVNCPKCGHKYSAQYRNCNECGTNREDYMKAQELAAWVKQLEDKRRQEEEELQRRRQEEARRLEEECRKANEPRILAFSASKYKRAEGDSVVFQWSTVNVDHCDLSWYNKRKKNCWHKCFPHNYGYGSLFVNLPSNCNKHTFGAGELLDMCSFIGLEQSVEICLEAFGKNGEIVSKYIRINMLAFAFSPLQVDSIEEI